MRRRNAQIINAWKIRGLKASKVVMRYKNYVMSHEHTANATDYCLIIREYPKGRCRLKFAELVKRDSGMIAE